MPAPSGQEDVALSILALAEAIKAGQTNGVSEKLDTMAAFLMAQEQARPHENVFNPPMVSHYNPLGERDFPRPDLKCDVSWTGFKLNKECLTRDEIELLNRLEPGDYTVRKGDGAQIQFVVTEKVGNAGKRERLSIFYPCKSSEDRSNHLSMANYMRQVLGEDVTNDDLRLQIDALKRQLSRA
jgi:hypothetical protein